MKSVLEQKFDYKGYPCAVLFMPGAYRCGYVGLPKGHKLAGKPVDALSYLDCHGGITYSEPSLYGVKDANIWWWIGFDCAHCFDGFDVEMAKQYFGGEEDFVTLRKYMEEFWSIQNEEYESCSATYVKNECMKIIDEIEEME